jgi:hypothetical protein
MDAVFLLYHVFVKRQKKEEDLDERAKLIGVYRTEEDATAAIGRVRDQPGFRDHPDGFQIDRYPLNMDHWAEGFITVP